MAEASVASASFEELDHLIQELLISEESPIHVNSFWNRFSLFHEISPRDLPKPKDFGVQKREQLLRRCKKCTIFKAEDGKEYVKSTQQPKAAVRKAGKEGDKKNDKRKQAQSGETNHSHNMAYNNPFNVPGPSNSHARHDMRQYYSQQGQHGSPMGYNQGGWGGGGGGGGGYRSSQSRSYSQNTPTRTHEEINAVALDCIDRLVEAREYVSVERIEKLLLEHFKAQSLRDLNVRHLEQIKSVNSHIRCQSRVNAYIQAFVRVRAIATLHELHENLREYSDDRREDFEKLRLGPLSKQPLVYDYFKFPGNAEVPDIDTATVLDHLRNYLTENNLWTGKVEVDGFMAYLVTQYQVESPFQLGIRIKSLPLAVGVLKKSQRDMSTAISSSIRHFSSNFDESIASALRNFSANVLEEETGICTMRKSLMQMSAPRVVEQVFSKLAVLLDSLSYLNPTSKTHHVKTLMRNAEVTKQFSKILKSESFFASLFKLCVCSSWEDTHMSLQQLLEESNSDNVSTSNTGNTSSKKKAKPRPRIDEVVTKVISYLERCFVSGSLTLANLARIENKLLEEHDDFESFVALANRTFLDFVVTNEEVQRYLDDNGGATLGAPGQSDGSSSSSSYQATLQDLHEFILQTGLTDSSQAKELEGAFCQHYQVSEAKKLGHGSVASLQTGAGKSHRANKQHHVFFEGALCAKESKLNMHAASGRRVGLFGHQKRESALICLHQCPLLADMAEWSHWDLVFKPELGELKDFLRKCGGTSSFTVPGTKTRVMTTVAALETKPGTLLKLATNPSHDRFASAIVEGDVTTACGHLVSLVAANKGIQNTSLALLGNHVKTGLYKILAATPLDDIGVPTSSDAGSLAVGGFVVKCLTKLPLVTGQAVASQVFLEALSAVVGQTKSRELLPRCVTTDEERSRLQVLGLLLGIDQWSSTLEQRLTASPDMIQKSTGIAPQQEFVDTDIIELESDSSDEDSPVIFTSDESEDEDEESDIQMLPTRKKTRVEEPMVIEISESDSTDCVIEITSGDKSSDKEESTDTREAAEPAEAVSTSADPREEGPSTSSSVIPALDEATLIQWRVVDDIRRTEFGINVKLSDEGKKLMEKQQDRLGRSLNRLSNDLYSKDTHFVLELIQNADDNDYETESGSVPAIKFVVEPTKITVYNNECGFMEHNIRAVCDVGKSTKGKHKAGYIGQKGIGFKSVFRVTDCPEIHSNGYHIRFDLGSSSMGYILPHWVDTGADVEERWMTRIVLPLKDEVRQTSKLRQLAARFQDVHPSLLLFLHRLKSITVINKIGEYKAKMERRDTGNNIIEIRHTSGAERQPSKTDRWLVVKKMLDASHISSQAKSGVDVESTEIALAFPLHEVDLLQPQSLAPKQPVFAYLPLRSYGFRFIIQGDFDVPSSREDVDRDSMWNQWLQSELHTLFVDALQAFKEQRNLSVVEAVCLFVRFIPLEDEILDFFRPVASQILHHLRSEECLPAEPVQGKPPVWCLPSQLILATDSLLRKVVTPELLQSQLGLSYLHHEVTANINPSLLTSLGVQLLQTSHLLEVGRALASSLAEIKPGEDRAALVGQLACWMASVFCSLEEFNVDKQTLAQISALPIVPLAGGQVATLKDQAVFFPLAADEVKDKATDRSLLLYLERDLRTVDPMLFTALDDVARPQARRLLELLGVRRLRPADIIHHHIIPALQDPSIMGKQVQLLVAYLVYIKEELDRQPNLLSMEELRPLALVVTNSGLKCPAKQNVHFPPAYGNKFDLTRDLPGYDWILVDLVYLQRCSTHQDIHTWHLFLSQLGVHDLIAVNEEKITVSHQDLADSAWSKYASQIPRSETDFELKDFDSSEFTALVSENRHPEDYHQQMQVLFDVLDTYWDTHFGKFMMTQLIAAPSANCPDQRPMAPLEVGTTFAMMLKNLNWVPAVEMHMTSDSVGTIIKQQHCSEQLGHSLYLHTAMTERLLAHHVPYLHSLQTPCSQMCNQLGVNTALNTDILRNLLIKWGTRTALDTPRKLLTSVAHAKALYSFLHERLPPKEMQDLFHDNSVIFVPCDNSIASMNIMGNDVEAVVEGELLARGEARWADPSGLFYRYAETVQDHGNGLCAKPHLSKWYRDQEDLMLRSARVQAKPSLLEYAQLLDALAVKFPVKHVLLDALQLMSILGEAIQMQAATATPMEQSLSVEAQAMVTHVRAHAVIPTKAGRWVCCSDHPLIPDDRQIERLFAQKDGVQFVVTDDKALALGVQKKRSAKGGSVQYDSSLVVALYKACGVKSLSEELVSEFVTLSYQVSPPVHRFMAAVLPFVQKLLCTEFPEVYEQLQAAKIDERLPSLKFGQVASLEVVYRLRPLPDVVVVINEQCKLKDDADEFTFYVHKDSVTSHHAISKEIARYFSAGNDACMKEIRSLLIEVYPLLRSESAELKKLVEERDLQELPEHEKSWQLSAPPVVKLPQQPAPEPPSTADSGSRPPTPVEGTDGGLKCWPPNSNPTAVAKPRGPGGSRPTSMWPPPQPPSRPDVSQLPEGLRAARSDLNLSEKSQRESQSAAAEQRSREDGERSAAGGGDSGGYSRGGPSRDGTSHGGGSGGGYSTGRPGHGEMGPGGDQAQHPGGELQSSKEPNQEDSGPEIMEVDNASSPSSGADFKSPAAPRPSGSGQKRPRVESGSETYSHPLITENIPSWNDDIVQETLEEVSWSGELPSTIEEVDNASEDVIGRWGEELVYNYLLSLKEDANSDVFFVKWVNQERESGWPYDCEVHYYNKETETTRRVYIEVKATCSERKGYFAVSLGEIRQALAKEADYHLYRVFNAGKSHGVRLTKLENLAAKLENKNVRLFLVI